MNDNRNIRDELVALFELEGLTPKQASELADDFLAYNRARLDTFVVSLRNRFRQQRTGLH